MSVIFKIRVDLFWYMQRVYSTKISTGTVILGKRLSERAIRESDDHQIAFENLRFDITPLVTISWCFLGWS